MNIFSVRESLNHPFTAGFDLYERRPGSHQLILPIHHEDGDMVEIYLADSPKGDEYVRICDYGLTLMRLSYTYEISTPTRQQIFESILINNGISNEEGNLYLDAPMDKLYEGILQFAGCAQKVCNMRYWSREITRSAFYDDLEEYITSDLKDFSPSAALFPLPDYPTGVDWSLTLESWSFFVFGVHSNDKAKVVALALLEFQKGPTAVHQPCRPRGHGSVGQKRTTLPHPQCRQAISRPGRLPGDKRSGYSPARRCPRMMSFDYGAGRAEQVILASHFRLYPAYRSPGTE